MTETIWNIIDITSHDVAIEIYDDELICIIEQTHGKDMLIEYTLFLDSRVGFVESNVGVLEVFDIIDMALSKGFLFKFVKEE